MVSRDVKSKDYKSSLWYDLQFLGEFYELKSIIALRKSQSRDIWKNESSNFTPWLAQESNLALLSETLRMNLQLEGIELPVGAFRADLLCKDLFLDKLVLI